MIDPLETLQGKDLVTIYGASVENTLKQQWLASKVWATVAAGMWALFLTFFAKIILFGFEWALIGGLVASLLFGWIFTVKIAPIFIGGKVDAISTNTKK